MTQKWNKPTIGLLGSLLLIAVLILTSSKNSKSIQENTLKNLVVTKKNVDPKNITAIDSIYCDINQDTYLDAIYIFKLDESYIEVVFFTTNNKILSNSSNINFNSSLVPNNSLIHHNIYLNCDNDLIELSIEEQSAHPLSYTTLYFKAKKNQVFLKEMVYKYRDYEESNSGIPFKEKIETFNFNNKAIEELNILNDDKSKLNIKMTSKKQ